MKSVVQLPEGHRLTGDPAVIRQAFGRKLQRLMIDKSWNQSDLARAAFGTDGAGNVKGRDAVSSYIRGRSFPEPTSMEQLAKALRVKVEDLYPSVGEENESPDVMDTKQVGPDRIRVSMTKIVTPTTLAEILMVLAKDPHARQK